MPDNARTVDETDNEPPFDDRRLRGLVIGAIDALGDVVEEISAATREHGDVLLSEKTTEAVERLGAVCLTLATALLEALGYEFVEPAD